MFPSKRFEEQAVRMIRVVKIISFILFSCLTKTFPTGFHYPLPNYLLLRKIIIPTRPEVWTEISLSKSKEKDVVGMYVY